MLGHWDDLHCREAIAYNLFGALERMLNEGFVPSAETLVFAIKNEHRRAFVIMLAKLEQTPGARVYKWAKVLDEAHKSESDFYRTMLGICGRVLDDSDMDGRRSAIFHRDLPVMQALLQPTWTSGELYLAIIFGAVSVVSFLMKSDIRVVLSDEQHAQIVAGIARIEGNFENESREVRGHWMGCVNAMHTMRAILVSRANK